MKSILLLLLVIVAVSATEVRMEMMKGMPSNVESCIRQAMMTSPPAVMDEIRTCAGKGGDVMACFKTIPQLAACFPA